MIDDIPELSNADFEAAISARVRKRLMQGKFESGEDIAALRRFVRLTQAQFAQAMGISIHTLRNWEQGRRTPEGPPSLYFVLPQSIHVSSVKTST